MQDLMKSRRKRGRKEENTEKSKEGEGNKYAFP
jgi:hypothetical protein